MERDGSKEKAEMSKEKTKARKSGPSLLRKTEALGTIARIFSATVYWEPTHKEYRLAVHVPEGWDLPDVNSLIAAAVSSHTQPPTRRTQQTRVARLPRRRTQQPAHPASGQQQPLRRSSRQQARRRTRQSTRIDPYDFPDSETEELEGRQPELDGVDVPSLPITEGTGAEGSVMASPAEESHQFVAAEWAGAAETGASSSQAPGGAPQGRQSVEEEVDTHEPREWETIPAYQMDCMQPHMDSPFGGTSWMDLDFIGEAPQDTMGNGVAMQDLQQGGDVAQPRDPSPPEIASMALSRPVPSVAWWAVAQELLDLLKRILSKDNGKAG